MTGSGDPDNGLRVASRPGDPDGARQLAGRPGDSEGAPWTAARPGDSGGGLPERYRTVGVVLTGGNVEADLVARLATGSVADRARMEGVAA
ncbi:hypothetical protein B0E53_02170 [Micromonospora sp. MH33]|uniref:hypothetical protein n=1 Tax=Micromonospora sp. MH33 TaxID=1945509 RepID=UPI000D27D6D8|nr:hypothetical protein [Micromonospora sp. MH33]PSK65852.1 hypothetical protein B0E53_02170 [Micromonospora sp. MH33]